MKKLLFVLTGLALLNLVLPAQIRAQSCCISKPICQVVTCDASAPVEKSASAEVNVFKAETQNQVAQVTFASFMQPVLNVSSVLFASQIVALLNQMAACDPSDCDPSCCIPPICDPSACDLSKCSAKKE